jgi:hypothetical protein
VVLLLHQYDEQELQVTQVTTPYSLHLLDMAEVVEVRITDLLLKTEVVEDEVHTIYELVELLHSDMQERLMYDELPQLDEVVCELYE